MRVLRRMWCVIGLGVLWYSMIPLPVSAQASPATNPVCWSHNACQEQFKTAGWTFTENNFLKGQPTECAAGGSDWGACVPISKTQLAIRFNGVDTVQNIADYMRILYVYIVGVAGLIAAFLIVKGGLEYITAGGESGRITSAKATLGSATLGLVLVFGSYVILNTINPDLVNLHVPNTYMLRPITLGGGFCQDMNVPKDSSGNEKKFAVAKQGADPAKATYDYTKEETTCGKQFFIPDGAGQTCMGKSCANAKWCKGYDEKSYQTLTDEERSKQTPCTCTKEGNCEEASLGGQIILADKAKYATMVWLNVLCKNDEAFNLRSLVVKGANQYNFKNGPTSTKTNPTEGEYDINKNAETACGGKNYDNIKGYYLTVEVQDTSGIGPTQNDQWIGGKSLCRNPSCPWYGRGGALNTGHLTDALKSAALLINSPEGILFTTDEMETGFTCDLDISLGSFPNLSNPIFGRSEVAYFPCTGGTPQY